MNCKTDPSCDSREPTDGSVVECKWASFMSVSLGESEVVSKPISLFWASEAYHRQGEQRPVVALQTWF